MTLVITLVVVGFGIVAVACISALALSYAMFQLNVNTFNA